MIPAPSIRPGSGDIFPQRLALRRLRGKVATEPCARDGVEATLKIKCFLRKPDAVCTILAPMSHDHLREMESCRRQVAAQ